MTIAACYVSPEGVVFGADSTSTYSLADGNHYFNHGQKIFEVGENSTIGIVTWGLGGLDAISYRRLIADLADDMERNPAASVQEVADRWASLFWPPYENGPFQGLIQECRDLSRLAPFDPDDQNASGMRNKDEEERFLELRQGLFVGFCIGGYILPDRSPSAFQTLFDPLSKTATVDQLPLGSQMFWGAPNMISRLINGYDEKIAIDILNSGKWNGTSQEIQSLLKKYHLNHPIVPIRDAIDFTYSCIYSTIKAFKFSNLSQICGGKAEIAVITCDRNFRWVRHKEMDAAIAEGRT